ncbi:hypothetical protein OEZ86_012523 [Tetradesmus obliquus]|nr:hypothetical protein OEZ86_012523 [Tetradesmus obliquus]
MQQLSTGSNAAAVSSADDGGGINEDELCVVCWEGRRSVALVHGDDAHLCLCPGCAALYDYAAKGCPMCRRAVVGSIKVY